MKIFLRELSESLEKKFSSDFYESELEPHSIKSFEARITYLVISWGFYVEKTLLRHKYNDTLQFLLADIPAIFLNLLKGIVNLKNGTVFHAEFYIPGEAQVLEELGKLRIEIYSRDHLPPHFHVKTPFSNVKFLIEDCSQIGKARGEQFSRRELNIIKEWHSIHKEELISLWKKFHNNKSY